MAELATVAGWLGGPWGDPEVRRGLVEVALVGIAAGPIGCWVILYRQAYSAESLAHSMLPGLALAAVTGLPLLAGGAAGLLVAAPAIAATRALPRQSADTAVAVVVTSLVGAGTLIALAPGAPADIEDVLFGNPLAVSDADLAAAAVLAGLTVAVLVAAHRALLAVGFDRASARALGVPAGLVEGGLLTLLAAAILVGVQGLGNLLVFAIVIGPAAAARLLAHSIAPLTILAAAIAATVGTAGLYLSYYAGTEASASVAGAAIAVYLLALLARQARA